MSLLQFLEGIGNNVIEARKKEFGTNGIESPTKMAFRLLHEQDQREKEEAIKMGIRHPNEHIVHVVVHHKND